MGYKLQAFLKLSISFYLVVLNCANPVDKEPLRWKTVTEIPITNEDFVVADQLDSLFDMDSMDILRAAKRYKDEDLSVLAPDTVIGDTLEFSVFKRDSSNFEIHEEKLKEQLYTATLGPVALTNAPEMAETLNVSSPGGPFNISLPVVFDKVYQIVFYDTVINVMQVKLTNLSAVEISSISLEIEGVGSGAADRIAAGESAMIQIPVSGKTLGNQVRVNISGTKSTNGAVQIPVTTSVNGLIASSLSVDDHLVTFRKEFVNSYEMTDSVDIDYVDIKDGFFIYEVTNHTGLELRVRGIHEHLWKTSFAERNSYTKFEDLKNTSTSDSVDNYFGFITTGEVVAPPRFDQTFSQENISQSRLFAEWDSVLQKSVTRVRYVVSTGNPGGDTINLHANDTLIFSIRSDFKYSKLCGTVVKPYEITSDTERVAIKFPWGESAPDSLRGKFILHNVYGDLLLRTQMSPNSYIDSVFFNFEVFGPDNANIKDSLADKFVGVGNGSFFKRLIDITDVVNLFPDTIAIITRMHVPRGTRILSENDLQVSDADYNKYIGRMSIGAIADFRLNARFDWEVKEMANMDLGSGDFAVFEAMRYLRKLEQRQLDFEMKIFNSSNLNIILYALIAPHHLIDTLDSMSSDEAFHLIINKGEAEKRGLVNFLGDRGIRIPARSLDSAVTNVVHWDHQQLETVLSSDTCGWRWFLQFQKSDRDALLDNDYIRINSMLHIEGINSTDSLIMW